MHTGNVALKYFYCKLHLKFLLNDVHVQPCTLRSKKHEAFEAQRQVTLTDTSVIFSVL